MPVSASVRECPLERVASGASGRYAQPVAVRVFEMHFTPGKTLLINWNAELLGNAVDVTDVEMNEGVWSCVALVLREVDVDVSSCNGNEPRKTGLELMLPFLPESEPLVPRDSACRVLNVENRHDLLVHAAQITGREKRHRMRKCSGMTPERRRKLGAVTRRG
jgi:hypothetical protein